MMRLKGFSNRGFSYIELVFSLAILGICFLILVPSIIGRNVHNKRMEYNMRAVSALASQADLIRAGTRDALTTGTHEFTLKEQLLQDLPEARASYRVFPTNIPGLKRVHLVVSWQYGGTHDKELEIYVRP
jgi:prepilin-type N-terminal cleavage/methylation domain-containing protein